LIDAFSAYHGLDVHHVGSQARGLLLVLQYLAANVGVEPDKLA
jgi:hypothetical protein